MNTSISTSRILLLFLNLKRSFVDFEKTGYVYLGIQKSTPINTYFM
jgi:hypothetical protein